MKLLLMIDKDDPQVDGMILQKNDLELKAGTIEMNANWRLRTIRLLEVQIQQRYDDKELLRISKDKLTPE